jgi:hypothetical protein
MITTTRRSATTLAQAAVAAASLLFTGSAMAFAAPAAGNAHTTQHSPATGLRVRVVIDGSKLHHRFSVAGKPHTEALAGPDDLTTLGGHLFTAFQNGVGSQGEPSTDGNTDSTIVEFTPGGHVLRQWDIKGKCDGLTADPVSQLLIATVNEDANSSVYLFTPNGPAPAQVEHFHYNRPLPHKGGTDAISVYHGVALISASAPGTTGKPAPQPIYPAVYVVTFHRATHVATITPLFGDEARALVANVPVSHPKTVRLALTDPDSSSVVPHGAMRFGGDFMLTSQGDKEQIFVLRSGRPGSHLAVLRLSQSVDDTAWAISRSGRLYASDSTSDTVDVVTGRFPVRAEFVSVTPCDAANAPATCPGPGFPANYLGAVDPFTGHVTRVPVSGATLNPKGLLFIG